MLDPRKLQQDNDELEPPETETAEHECVRECPTAPCSICGSDAPISEPEIEEEPNSEADETSTKK